MNLKQRATREELFGADEFSTDWVSHQQYRMDRMKAIHSEKFGVPSSTIRFGYEEKLIIELFSRTGERKRYRPKGVILDFVGTQNALGMFEFEVAWVDPWGYFHQATRSFLDIRVIPMDEVSYMRELKACRKAQQTHMVRGFSTEL